MRAWYYQIIQNSQILLNHSQQTGQKRRSVNNGPLLSRFSHHKRIFKDLEVSLVVSWIDWSTQLILSFVQIIDSLWLENPTIGLPDSLAICWFITVLSDTRQTHQLSNSCPTKGNKVLKSRWHSALKCLASYKSRSLLSNYPCRVADVSKIALPLLWSVSFFTTRNSRCSENFRTNIRKKPSAPGELISS